VRFWDSSAVVPLLIRETASDAVRQEYERDPEIIAWGLTDVECTSALTRREREGSFDGSTTAAALARLSALSAAWQEVQPTARIRRAAIRLLRVHPLRAADALQLAAALAAAEGYPDTLPLVTLDERLADAAEREGFGVTRVLA